jgi:hypothetical protein
MSTTVILLGLSVQARAELIWDINQLMPSVGVTALTGRVTFDVGPFIEDPFASASITDFYLAALLDGVVTAAPDGMVHFGFDDIDMQSAIIQTDTWELVFMELTATYSGDDNGGDVIMFLSVFGCQPFTATPCG